jgi:DNA-directed RNA polymerase beta subunit
MPDPGIQSVFDTPPQPPTPAAPPGLRRFGDISGTRRRIFDNTLAAAKEIQPVSNTRFSLSLENPAYSGQEDFSPEEQKRAVLENRTLSRRLQGEWVWKDHLGEELGRKKATIANVPYLTDMGAFIYNGSKYLLSHQMRLRPGVFARRKENGELESHINVAKGFAHRVEMDPESGMFKIRIGQASIPLAPLLSAMGATSDEMKESWGPELTARNLAKNDPRIMDKLYAKVVGEHGDAPDTLAKSAAVAKAFHSMTLDPEVTKRTLGEPFANISPKVYLAATKKLLAINKGEAQSDDRDSPTYQRVMGPEDMFAEKINLAPNLMRRLLWKAANRGDIDRIKTGAFDDLLHGVILHSGLANSAEEINPSELFDHQSRVTRMGQGGIPSRDSIPDESRAVQPTHLGFIDPLRTPESENAGVDLRFARATRKGPDGRIYTQVRNMKTGQLEYKSPQDLADFALGFPGKVADPDTPVGAIHGGRFRVMPHSKIDYQIPDMESAFSPLANLIPGKSSVKGQRAVMASRMLSQALPLKDAEAPLVQSGLPDDPNRSFEEEYAQHMGAVRAAQGGRVTSTDGKISILDAEGKQSEFPLYSNFPYNRKTLYHQTPAVKVGDTVQPGQLLATSNYTDKEGTTALGKNLRVAYIPFRGLNFEDANIISESTAKRLTSEHAYQHGYEWDDRTKKGKKAFISIHPGVYDRKTMDNFTDDGIIKPGTVVNYGDPLILATREREPNQKSLLGSRPIFSDESVTWSHHNPGEVTDVAMTDKGANVVVKSYSPSQVGDKLSGRFGDKGIISSIIPDDQMPHDANGRPFELLANPLGVISRTNPAQLVEAALGKIAEKRGTPYKLQDFQDDRDLAEYAWKELQKHGVPDTEDVIDPNSGRKIPNVFTGNRWFMKLHHSAESGEQGRGVGEGYTSEGLPSKGGTSGSKRHGMLELSSMLSHGATSVIRDANLVRGQAQPQYWSQYMAGYNPPTPQIPFTHQKFVNQLKAAGINVVKEGPRSHIMALTNKDIDQLAGDREIQNTETVNWKDMSPVKGGLFSDELTGGHGGKRWSSIRLHEPMPSPAMEEPIRKVLGLTEPKFRNILAGKEGINGQTGPKGIAQALSGLNLDREIAQARADIASGKTTKRDAAIRKLGYLRDAQRLNIHPKDWMLDRVPVIPPVFRPVSVMGGAKKLPLVDDMNYLYKEVFDANNNLKELSAQADDVGDERLTLYDAFKGVTGMGDPVHPKNQESQVKGILRHVFGSSPKTSVIHRKLLGSQVDRVGRAVIAPDPNLDMDSVGLPEDSAWSIYHPDIVRRLVRSGMEGRAALRAVEARSPDASAALQKELEDGVVIYNRAPTLHRYGIMAARPKLTKHRVLTVSPLVIGGFQGDFDGDKMNFHVPQTPEARQEALDKMLPSRNLFSVADLTKAHYLPSQEYVGGLYEASARIEKDKPPMVFADKKAAIQAYRSGEIGVGRRVEIINH